MFLLPWYYANILVVDYQLSAFSGQLLALRTVDAKNRT